MDRTVCKTHTAEVQLKSPVVLGNDQQPLEEAWTLILLICSAVSIYVTA